MADICKIKDPLAALSRMDSNYNYSIEKSGKGEGGHYSSYETADVRPKDGVITAVEWVTYLQNRCKAFMKSRWHDIANRIVVGNRLLRQGDYNGALRQYGYIKPYRINDPNIHFLKGNAYLGLRKFDDAEGEYKNTLKYNSKHLMAQLGLAMIYIEKPANPEELTKNYAEAKKYLDMALGTDAGNAYVHFAFGYYYIRLDLLDIRSSKDILIKARDHFKRALSIDPKMKGARDGLKLAEEKLKELEK